MVNKIDNFKPNTKKLIAISYDSKINNKKHPCYDCFENESNYYFVLKNAFDNRILFKKLRDFFQKNLHLEFSLDLKSFLDFSNNKLASINAIVFASTLVHTLSISMINKQKSFDKNFYIYNYQDFKSDLDKALALVPIHMSARQIQMLPNNLFSIEDYCLLAKKTFAKYDTKKVSVKILDYLALKKHHLDLILGVGSGSKKPNQPAMIVIEFHNNLKDKQTIGLIGKGIMFDTGGLSLKPSTYMQGMHYDKSGSAIVFGVMEALIKTNQPVNAVAFLPLAVNDINESSYKINDILTSLNQKTIEITNTDAEGRLLLVNALEYAQKNYSLKDVITIATLTGAVEIAFGNTYTPFWTNNQSLVNDIFLAADNAAESVWQMPMHYEYVKKLETSKVADVVNSEKSRAAGSSVAAEFIRYFAKNVNFLHFDIASSIDFNDLCYPNMLNTLYYYVIQRFSKESKK